MEEADKAPDAPQASEVPEASAEGAPGQSANESRENDTSAQEGEVPFSSCNGAETEGGESLTDPSEPPVPAVEGEASEPSTVEKRSDQPDEGAPPAAGFVGDAAHSKESLQGASSMEEKSDKTPSAGRMREAKNVSIKARAEDERPSAVSTPAKAPPRRTASKEGPEEARQKTSTGASIVGTPRAAGAPLEAKGNEGIWQQVLREARQKNPETPCGFLLLLG